MHFGSNLSKSQRKRMATSQHPSNTKRSAPLAKGSDYSSWLSRDEATDLLGVSKNTLLNWETRDLLHPARVQRTDNRGFLRSMYVYDPRELAKLPTRRQLAARTPGEAAGRAFRMFAEGTPLADIVIELHETPTHIEALHEQWLNMGGADLVISPGAREALERVLGAPFKGVAELVELVTAKIKPVT